MGVRTWTGTLACGLLLFATACSNKEAADAMSQSAAESPAAAPSAGAPAPDAASQLASAVLTQGSADRRFIRTARVEFRVQDVFRSALEIEDLVARLGGYVARNDIRNEIEDTRQRDSGDGWRIELSSYTTRGDLQVRIPSERAQEFMRALSRHVEFLDRRAVDAQLELMAQQLAYLRQQQAQQALTTVAAEPGKTGAKVHAVEAVADAQAQRDEATLVTRQLEDRIALATIELSMHQAQKVTRTQQPDLDDALHRDQPGFFTRLGHSLSTGWHGLLAVLVALATLWPLWLVLAGLVAGVRLWRGVKREVISGRV